VDQLEGRNPVLECMARQRRPVRRIWMDRGAKSDPKISRILALAAERDIRVDRVDRRELDKMSKGRVHNGVVAHADPLVGWTTRALLDDLFSRGKDPFLILADGLSYEHNLGAILRTSLGFGVDGVIVPTRRGASISPVVQRVSMGAVEEVPIIHEGLFSALKHVKKAGIPIVGADMGGASLIEARLSGPLALVMGAEGSGLSSKLRERCGTVVSIPLSGELESLNVSVAASVLMYEKRRQDGWF